MDKLTLTVTTFIDIDIKLIKDKINKSGISVKEAVEDYITGLGDEYHLIGDVEKQRIYKALREDGFED